MHKFGRQGNGEAEGDGGTKAFIEAIQKLPPGIKAKGDIFCCGSKTRRWVLASMVHFGTHSIPGIKSYLAGCHIRVRGTW